MNMTRSDKTRSLYVGQPWAMRWTVGMHQKPIELGPAPKQEEPRRARAKSDEGVLSRIAHAFSCLDSAPVSRSYG
jgi:hypothetical protein